MPRLPTPGGAVFSPRTFAANPRKFGNSSARLSDAEVETPQRAAAELQHAIVNRIRECLLDDNHSLRSLATEDILPRGISYDRLQRIARGETMLTLTDLMFWAQRYPELAAFIGETIAALTAPSVDEPA